MVSEVSVHFRHIHFGHMAACAVLRRLWAGRAWMAGGDLRSGGINMAGEALLVVRRRFRLQLLVRIVASCAGQPRIAFVSPALAGDEAIGRGPCR